MVILVVTALNVATIHTTKTTINRFPLAGFNPARAFHLFQILSQHFQPVNGFDFALQIDILGRVLAAFYTCTARADVVY